MAERVPPFAAADLAFVDVMIAVTGPTLGSPARREIGLDLLAQVAAGANRRHPALGPLIDAAEAILAADALSAGPDKTTARSAALLRGHMALADLALWRLSRAAIARRAEATKGDAA